jgi:hypothetical protein
MRKITIKKTRMALLNNSEELYFKSMILLKFWEKAVTVVYQKESARKLVD